MQLRAGWACAFLAIHAAAEILGERFSSVVICWVGLVISSGLGWLCFRTERGGGYFVLLSQRRNDYRLVSIDAFSVHHYYKLPFSSIVLFCIFFSVEMMYFVLFQMSFYLKYLVRRKVGFRIFSLSLFSYSSPLSSIQSGGLALS